MSDRVKDYPTREEGLRDVGVLARLLVERGRRFRVGTTDHEDGTEAASFTLLGYASVDDVLAIVTWARQLPRSRHVAFSSESGEVMVVRVRYLAGEGEE